MQKQILDRYSRSSDGSLIIEIAADRVEDLYNDYQKTAPFLKKDLEQELVDYIVDSVSEIGRERFLLKFSIAGVTDEQKISRVKLSIQEYFEYLKELELREMNRMFRTSFILFLIGIALLIFLLWINQKMDIYDLMVTQVLTEGLTVAAWVSLWEALANFLINWAPHRRLIGLYRRIAGAPVTFQNTGGVIAWTFFIKITREIPDEYWQIGIRYCRFIYFGKPDTFQDTFAILALVYGIRWRQYAAGIRFRVLSIGEDIEKAGKNTRPGIWLMVLAVARKVFHTVCAV